MTFDRKALTYRIAQQGDWAELSRLVNTVYRTKVSDKQWTTEATLVGGTRLIEKEFLVNIADPHCRILLLELADQLLGCVRLLLDPDSKCHLGMLSIHETSQNTGLGRILINYAEEFAKKSLGASAMILHVIAQRPELIEWYVRLGYKDTGLFEKFDESPEDDVVHLQAGLYFKILSKAL